MAISLTSSTSRREYFSEDVATRFPENRRTGFRDWSGVKEHRARNRLEPGKWFYRAVR